jgi:hypothetical protein
MVLFADLRIPKLALHRWGAGVESDKIPCFFSFFQISSLFVSVVLSV